MRDENMIKKGPHFILVSLQHLILCRDGVYICKSCLCKIKKNKVPCHVVTGKLLVEYFPRELW